MAITHVAPTIAALRDAWFMGPVFGGKYGEVLSAKFQARGDQQAVDDALALGFYKWHSEGNKQKRHMMRGVLLAEFLMRNQPLTIRDQLVSQIEVLSAEQLKAKFKNLFPAFNDNGKRVLWAPANFTAMNTLNALNAAADWRVNAIPAYKLFVHTIRHGAAVLNDPIGTLSNWTAISMSVLSSQKPICYSNHGLILSVPQNNVLTTSPTDQWFDNYAGTDRSVKAQGQPMALHIAEKTLVIGGLLSPDEVLAKQNTPQAMENMAGAAVTKHNEVVVCGLAGQKLPYGLTGALTLLGVFVQTKMDGTLPVDLVKSQGRSADVVQALTACAQQYHVPLLYLPTAFLDP
jgi:hypothetical protein